MLAETTQLKTGYIEFARLESSAKATHAVMLSPAVAMPAEVHCQRPPAGAQLLHISTMPMSHADNLPASWAPDCSESCLYVIMCVYICWC